MTLLLPNQGPVVPREYGRVFTLRLVAGRWCLVSPTAARNYTPAGTYTYIVDDAGEVWVSTRAEHIVLSGGRPVRFAGTVRFTRRSTARGRLLWWDDASGHYRPPARLAGQAGLPMPQFVSRFGVTPRASRKSPVRGLP